MKQNKQFQLNKMIFFLFNVMIMSPVLVGGVLSGKDLIGRVILTAVIVLAGGFTLAALLLWSDPETPASGYLVTFAALDTGLYLAVSYDELVRGFSLVAFQHIWRSVHTKWPHLVLLLVFIVLVFVFGCTECFLLLGIMELCSLAVLINPWNSLLDVPWEINRQMLFAVCLVTAGVWIFLLWIAVAAALQRDVSEAPLEIVLFFGLLFLIAAEKTLVQNTVRHMSAVFEKFFHMGYTWGQAVLAALLLFICAWLMHDDRGKEGQLGADSFLVAAGIPFVFAVKISQNSSFVSCLWLLVLLLAGSCLCLANETENEKTFGFSSVTFLLIQMLVVCLSLAAMGEGFRINAWVTCIAAALYVFLRSRIKGKGKNILWMLVVSGVMAEGLAYYWKTGFSEKTFWLIIMVWSMAMAVLCLTAFWYPEKKNLPAFWGLCIAAGCAVFLIVMIAAGRGVFGLLFMGF